MMVAPLKEKGGRVVARRLIDLCITEYRGGPGAGFELRRKWLYLLYFFRQKGV
jgi:hypothetical protein